MAYSKIRQPKLSDVIEQQLEFLILEGTLRPGEKLPPERELAKQFDVSRPSLREAIQRLEAKYVAPSPGWRNLCAKQPVAELQRPAGRTSL